MNHVILIGFMGAGKSTVGRLVAEALRMPFVDLDTAIESSLGTSVAEVFQTLGEAAFRTAESRALASLADVPPTVVACGGGVVMDDDNRRLLKELGHVIYLRVGAEEALARIGDTSGRPLLASGDAVSMASTLLAARETLYCTVADTVVDTSGVRAHEVAEKIVGHVRLTREEGA